MFCQSPSLLTSGTITNLAFVDRCEIGPKSGIGHHFHYNSDEMFVIFDSEAQFTIDGRTSVLKGPAGAPLRATHSHAIYNPSDKPVQFMNINIRVGPPRPAEQGGRSMAGGARAGGPGQGPGRAGRGAMPFNFAADTGGYDMGDERVGVALDPVPVFMPMLLRRETLRPVNALHGGKGAIQYRRAVGSAIFNSNWAFVDHYLLPPGTSIGRHMHNGVEEFYYVMNGSGTVQVDNETAPIKDGDAVPVRVKQVHSIENTSSGDLELMVVGIALEKGKLDVVEVK